MNIERMIKTEAKKRLSGNWPIAFFSVLNLLFIPILSLLLISMAYVVVGEDNDVAKALSDSPQTAALFVLFHVVGVAAVIFLSPLYTGFVRIYSSIANGKTVDPSDLIYFFETPSRYKKGDFYSVLICWACFGGIGRGSGNIWICFDGGRRFCCIPDNTPICFFGRVVFLQKF